MNDKKNYLDDLLQDRVWRHTGVLAGVLAPQLSNPPGLRQIGFRLGTQAQFAGELLRRLGSTEVDGRRPLAKLNDDSSNDWIVALLESWAMVGDVLSFYQDRYANEAYIGTATQPDSIHALLVALGQPTAPLPQGSLSIGDPRAVPSAGQSFPPEPGASATMDLALTVTANPATPSSIAMPAGSIVNVYGTPSGLPATYEITGGIKALPSLSAIPLWIPKAPWPVVLPAGASGLLLNGKVALAKGGTLLLPPQGADAPWAFVTIADSQPYEGGGKTLVSLTGTTGLQPLVLEQALEGSAPMLPFGATAKPLDQCAAAAQLANVRSGGLQVCSPLALPPSFTADNAGFPNAAVRDMAVGADGTVYLATSAGIYAWLPGAAAFTALSQGLSTRDLYTLVAGRDGMVYVGGGGGNVARISGPGSAWQSIDGNRSMIQTAGGPKPPLYSALPQAVVLRLRVVQENGATAVFALTSTGISGNWMDSNGWQVKNPPTGKDVGASDHPTSAAISDFVVVAPPADGAADGAESGDPLTYLVIAAVGGVITPYWVQVGLNAAPQEKSWWQKLWEVFESSGNSHKMAGNLPDPTGGAIAPNLGEIKALLIAKLPADGKLLLAMGTESGIYGYSKALNAFYRLGTGLPGGTLLALASGKKTAIAGSGGTLILMATLDTGVWGLVWDGTFNANTGLPNGTWTELLPFTPRQGGDTALPSVVSKAVIGPDGSLYTLTPPVPAADWPGLHLDDDSIDLTTLSPLLAQGRYLVLADTDGNAGPTLRQVDKSALSTASGFGLPQRPVQHVSYASSPASAPKPSAIPLRQARAYASGKGHALAAPAALTAGVAAGDVLTVAGGYDSLDLPRRITVSGTAPRAALQPPAGLLSFNGPAVAQEALYGVAVRALAVSGQMVLAGGGASSLWPQGQLYRSADGGKTWASVLQGLSGATAPLSALAFGADGMALAVAGGLFSLAAKADSWTALSGPPATASITCLTALADGGFALGTGGGGLWIGDASGTTWTPAAGTGLTSDATIVALAAAADGSVFVSLDSGAVLCRAADGSVTAYGNPLGSIIITALAADQGRVLAGGGDGRLMLSGARIGQWADSGLSVASGRPVAAIAAGSGDGWAVGGPGWLACSRDGGANWDRLPTPQSNDVAALAGLGGGALLVGCGSSWVAESLDGKHQLSYAAPTVVASLERSQSSWLDQGLLPSALVSSLKASLDGQALSLPVAAGVQAILPGRFWLIADTSAAAAPSPSKTAGRMAASGLATPSPQSAGLAVEPASAFLLVADPALPDQPVTVYAQPQPLTVAKAPVAETAGQSAFDLAVPGGAAQRLSMAETALAFLPSLSGDPTIREGATVTKVSADLTAGTSDLTLEAPLQFCFVAASVSLNANVLTASQGRPITNLPIGSGDAGKSGQSFAIPMPPLLFDQGSRPSERCSTLKISVNGQSWNQVESFDGLGPHDKAYVLEVVDGVGTVTFGDGIRGSRVPSGSANVLASFRSGAGLGQVRAPNPADPTASALALAASLGGQPSTAQSAADASTTSGLAVLTNVPNGVQPVATPVPSAPAVAPTTPAVRQQQVICASGIPQRLISEADYLAFARAYPGIGHAVGRAFQRSGKPPFLALAVTPSQGDDAAPDADTMAALALDIRRRQTAPATELHLCGVTPRSFTLAAMVWGDASGLDKPVQAALDARFQTSGSQPGHGVTSSEVIAVIQSVPGVRGVVLTALSLLGAQPMLRDELPARPLSLHPETHAVIPPDWLLLTQAALTILPAQPGATP